jgi:hypothetical protein
MYAPAMPKTFDWDHANRNPAILAPTLSVNRIDRVANIPTDYRKRIEACTSGTVSVRVRWPLKAALDRGNIGFRFKLLSADSGLAIYDEPLKGEVKGNSMLFDLFLFESPYATKDPLKITIEVYAVNARHQRVTSAARQPGS